MFYRLDDLTDAKTTVQNTKLQFYMHKVKYTVKIKQSVHVCLPEKSHVTIRVQRVD